MRAPASGLLLALAACFPLTMLLPLRWGWENGVLESLQVLVLLGGLGLAGLAWQRERPSPLALLALCAMPVWAVLAARELSWGAVLGAPLAMAQHGPLFSSKTLWYKPLVMPVVVLLLGWMLLLAWRHRLDRLLRRLAADGRLPWPVFGIALCAELGSNCAEGRLSCSFAAQWPQAMVFEELVELLAYAALVLGQARVLGRGAVSQAAVAAPANSLP